MPPQLSDSENTVEGEATIDDKVTAVLLKLLKRTVCDPLSMLVLTPTGWVPKLTVVGEAIRKGVASRRLIFARKAYAGLALGMVMGKSGVP